MCEGCLRRDKYGQCEGGGMKVSGSGEEDNTPKFNKKLESCIFNLPWEVWDNVEDPYGTIFHSV